MNDKLSRRDVLHRSAALSVLALVGSACGKETKKTLTCTDTSSITPTDLNVRSTLAYVDVSTEPGKSCSNCQQFVAGPDADHCGTCKVVKGPINPKGYCKSYAAKTA
jgi:hypothetical protein